MFNNTYNNKKVSKIELNIIINGVNFYKNMSKIRDSMKL
jgi:hypothetical protein